MGLGSRPHALRAAIDSYTSDRLRWGIRRQNALQGMSQRVVFGFQGLCIDNVTVCIRMWTLIHNTLLT